MKSKTAVALLLVMASTILLASATTALHDKAIFVTIGKPNKADNLSSAFEIEISSTSDSSQINGTVTNAVTTSPIKDANVTANGVSDLTDDDGHYDLEIAPGNYTVTVTKSGFISQSKNATVAVNQTTTVNFALSSALADIGWIVGSVTDANTSMPIEDAVITAGNKSDDTNSAGRYEIELAPGNYSVTAGKSGYVSQTMMGIVVRAGSVTALNFALVRVAPTTPEVTVVVTPSALNLRSNGRWITVSLQVFGGFSAKDINVSSIRLNSTIPVDVGAPIEIVSDNVTSQLTVKFSREAVEAFIFNELEPEGRFGVVELSVTGEFKDQTAFSGSDTIKIILNAPMSEN
jgi:hypothetical protein